MSYVICKKDGLWVYWFDIDLNTRSNFLYNHSENDIVTELLSSFIFMVKSGALRP